MTDKNQGEVTTGKVDPLATGQRTPIIAGTTPTVPAEKLTPTPPTHQNLLPGGPAESDGSAKPTEVKPSDMFDALQHPGSLGTINSADRKR